ncbi:MAG TPA: polysaccharide biosynthesis/export family protein [Allosphingosinicella sp.]|nr:polysaccharide biosynthesis/export family protein [Allosphingosinicella sp.]
MIVFGSSTEPARAPETMTAAGSRLRALVRAFLAVAVFGLVAACATRGGNIPYDVSQKDFGQPDAPSALVGTNAEYRISPLDKLSVTVFQVPDMSRDVDVDLGGNISMPLIGNVRAVDLTTAELQTQLEAQLGARYLRNPDVTVSIKETSRRHITIDGAVRSPGQFQVSGPTTLLQAVARAGGPDETANPRRVAVFRQIGGRRNAAAFDLAAIRRGNAEDPVIYTGDIIVVEGSRLRAIQREIFATLPLLTTFRPF